MDIAGEPFVAHQLRLLESRGIRRVVLCTGYLGEMIEAYVGDGHEFGVAVDYSRDGPTLLGTAGALRQARAKLGDQFMVLYGDSYLQCDYAAVVRAFELSGRAGLMTVFQNDGQLETSNVEFAHGHILEYDKAAPTARMRHIDYGLGVLDGTALDLVPAATAYDLASLYRDLLARQELAAYEVHERFYEVGSIGGLEELRRLIVDGPAHARVPS